MPQAALFAACLSSFIVYTLPKLQPDRTDSTYSVLLYISQQISYNVSFPAYQPPEFVPKTEHVAANALFFASLSVILIAAFLATMVKEWLRGFDHNLPPVTVPERRAKEREYRFYGLTRYHLHTVVAALPLLVQLSLLLFFAGLVVFMFTVDSLVASVTVSILAVGLLFYLALILIPIFDASAPYTSALSWLTASAEKGYTPSADIAIMDRLVSHTLVAPENASTFLVVMNHLCVNGSLCPISAPKWRSILFSLAPTLEQDKSIDMRGVMRVVTTAYDPEDPRSKVLVGLANKWVNEFSPQWESHSMWQDAQGISSRSQTRKQSPPSMLFRHHNGASIPPLSFLVKKLSDIKHSLCGSSSWSVACTRLRQDKEFELLCFEMYWFSDFFASPLFLALQPQLHERLVSGMIEFLTEALLLASMLPETETVPIIKSSLLVTFSLPDTGAPPALVTKQSPNGEENSANEQDSLFMISNTRINDMEIDKQCMARLLSRLRSGEDNMGILGIPLILAFMNIDPHYASYFKTTTANTPGHTHSDRPYPTPQSAPALSFDYLPTLLQVLDNLKESQAIEIFTTLLGYVDSRVKDPHICLDPRQLHLMEPLIVKIFYVETEELKTEREVSLNQIRHLQDPWLKLHLDNHLQLYFQDEFDEIILQNTFRIGDPAAEYIAETRLSIYEKWNNAHSLFLRVFERSSSLRTSLRSLRMLVPLTRKNTTIWDDARLARITDRLVQTSQNSDVKQDKLYSELLAIVEFMPELWENFPPAWKAQIVTTLRDIHWLEKLPRMAIGERLQDLHGGVTGSPNHNSGQNSAVPVEPTRDLIAENMLPFVARLLEAMGPLTDTERTVLQELIRLPDNFGTPAARNLISSALIT